MTLLTEMTDQEHEDRLVQARLNWTHLHQSILRACQDDDFDPFDKDRNPVPTLEDLGPTRTLN